MLKAHIFAKEMTIATKKKKYWLDYYQAKIIFPYEYEYVSLT